jgi:transposase, IS5 family
MAIKRTGQLGFADAVVLGIGSSTLDRIDGLVRWYRFDKIVGRLRDGGAGRAAWPPLVMVKALLLASLYGLSDRELEEAIGDRLSFRRFVGLSLEESVPDHSSLSRFRTLLVTEGLLDKLFGELDKQLEAAGVMVKRGTMLDATVIAAVSAPPGDAAHPSIDPDAGFSRPKGKQGSTFGYKAHVGVDEGSGLIRAVVTTPANVNDTTPADALIRGDEPVVWADAAYDTHARIDRLKAEGRKARIARRPNKHHDLPPRLRHYNRLIARRRAAIETTFATLKNRMRLKTIRYVGLIKASAQILLCAIAFNLRRWAAIAP